MIIHSFAVSFWLSLLSAAAFSAFAFAVYGSGISIIVFIIVFMANLTTLKMAYANRTNDTELKQESDTLAVLGMVGLFIGMLFAKLIVGLITLLLFLQLALNVNFKNQRQVFFAPMVCFVALMGAAIHSKHTGLAFYFLLFCIFSCIYFALIHINQVANSDAQQKTSQWSNRNRLTIGLILTFMSVFFYLVMPRFPAGNIGGLPIEGWGLYQNKWQDQLLENHEDLVDHFKAEKEVSQKSDNDSSNSQNSKTSSNSSSNDERTQTRRQYSLDDSIFFYVKSDSPVYLQEHVSTYFDGRSWHSLQYAYTKLEGKNNLFQLFPELKPTHSIEITTAKDEPSNLLTTDTTVALKFPVDELGRDYYDTLTVGTQLKKDTVYELQPFIEYKQNRVIDRHQSSPDDRDLQLPSNLDHRINDLATRLTAAESNHFEKANILEQHIKNNYQYSLTTIFSQNNIPLSDFLFQSKLGHCEYFATAMAIMLRTQGIPARMVSGFVAQDYNAVTGFYEVKGINAHAWVEAYIDDGWIIYEATGAYVVPEKQTNDIKTTNQLLKKQLEALKKQRQLLQEVEKKPATIKDYIQAFWHLVIFSFEQLWQILKYLIVIAGCGYIAYFFGKLAYQYFYEKYKVTIEDKRSFKAINNYQPKNTKDDIAFYLLHIQNMLARHSIIRESGMPIEKFVQYLKSNHLNHTNDLTTLTTLINQYYYQEHTYKTTDNELFIRLYHHYWQQLAD